MRFQAKRLVLEIKATHLRLQLLGSHQTLPQVCKGWYQPYTVPSSGSGSRYLPFIWGPRVALRSAVWALHWCFCSWNAWYIDFLIGTVKRSCSDKYRETQNVRKIRAYWQLHVTAGKQHMPHALMGEIFLGCVGYGLNVACEFCFLQNNKEAKSMYLSLFPPAPGGWKDKFLFFPWSLIPSYWSRTMSQLGLKTFLSCLSAAFCSNNQS